MMKLDFMTSTGLFGAVITVTTMGLFLNGASALDLGDFSALDQKVITQEAPKAGGIALIKEDTVIRKTRSQPMLTAIAGSDEGTYYDYARIEPAAGGNTSAPYMLPPGRASAKVIGVQPADTLSSRTVPAVAPYGMGGPNDSATDPTDPFAKVQARLRSSGVAQAPDAGSAHATAALEAGVTPTTPIAPLVSTTAGPSVAANIPAKAAPAAQPSASDLANVAPATGGDFYGDSQSSGTFND